MKRVTIDLPDELADLFSDSFILDRCEAGASRHTLVIHRHDENDTTVRHSRLGVKIRTETLS